MPRTPPRRRQPAQFTAEPIKLRLTPDDDAWIRMIAAMKEWKAPKVIRKCIELVRKRGLL